MRILDKYNEIFYLIGFILVLTILTVIGVPVPLALILFFIGITIASYVLFLLLSVLIYMIVIILSKIFKRRL